MDGGGLSRRKSCLASRAAFEYLDRHMTRRAIVAGLLLITLRAAPRAEPLSTLERQRLVAHLDMTEQWLVGEVSQLTAAQLAFKPAADQWSIAQVVDHLVVVGPIYWQDLQRAVRGPSSTARKSGTDADILWYGIDRTHREKAIPTEVPQGAPRDIASMLDAIRQQHAQLRRYIQTTSDDLRSHIVERQGSDAYQWALLISTHEQRHILQIRDIKAHPKYPAR